MSPASDEGTDVTASGVADAPPASRHDVDEEGLLAALVLAPGTYARNRFYALFREPRYRRVRRRAAQIRGLLRHLAGRGTGTVIDSRVRDGDGSETIRFHVDELRLCSTVRLEPFEAALVDVALSVAKQVEAPFEAAERVNLAVSRLR